MENIEQVLRIFWEKTRRAAELISQLRETNKQLLISNQNLEQELQKTHLELVGKETEAKKLKQEHAQMQAVTSGEVFTVSEKDEVKNRIRGLIAKINSHL
ncbi:MAG: hypothetical protein HZB59_06495 [Ignavibacteriales bacterium]|nr:hypothetical protein [Ignavibacteriales bacterium]